MTRDEIISRTKQCNITYHIPGKSDRSAMPLGNGELCASVWAEETGRICAYLSRSDALTEYDRTVKLGMLRYTLTPNPFTEGVFEQKLELENGRIVIRCPKGSIVIWIEMGSDTFRLKADFNEKISVKEEVINWRIKNHIPSGEFYCPADAEETADIVFERDGKIFFYHKNGKNVIKETAKIQNMEDCLKMLPDLLTGRIFGGCLSRKWEGRSYESAVSTCSEQILEKEFLHKLKDSLDKLSPWKKSMDETKDIWQGYWCKSYLFVEKDPSVKKDPSESLLPYIEEPMEFTCQCTSNITLAYTLTKYMTACCARGKMPINYNGMLFNLCPGLGKHFCTQWFGESFTALPWEFSSDVNPDERTWACEQLWQNIRHPYHSMLARGETEEMKALFRYYRRFWELNRARAKKYYGARGQHNTEMTMSFGLQSIFIYGRDRNGKPDGYADNRWGGAVDISPGLELVHLMLDYYEFTKDQTFLQEDILPYLRDLLEYIATRFSGRLDGKIIIGPLNSVETYRDTINPMPVVAGMDTCVKRVLSYPEDTVPERKWFLEYQELIPEIPIGNLLLPAKQYKEERFNVEIPELYAVFPFYCVDGKEEIARKTFEIKIKEFGIDQPFQIGDTPDHGSYSGWQYIGTVAALLGMTEKAEEILTENCCLTNPGTRFPAMWGPIYDAVPDADHGANILNQLQKMILQVRQGEVKLLPAFPKEWNVYFKLYVDKDSVVEAEFCDGKFSSAEQWQNLNILQK